jgi:aldose 1-epimerase
MALTGTQFELSAGEFAATIVEVGAGLRRFTFRGIDVTVPYGEDELPPKGSGDVLVPWPNRLRGGHYNFGGQSFQLALTEPAKNNAIHGLGRWVRWTPLAIAPASITLGVDLVPQTGWLFEVRVELTYALLADGGLVVTVLARNTGRGPAPFGAGFHPYLSTHGHRIDDVTVQVPAAKHLLLDDAQVPVGVRSVSRGPHDLRRGRRLRTLRLDDGFTDLTFVDGRGSAQVRTASGGAEVWFDAAFGYLQIYTLDELVAGLPGVAVEPMTCPADAFNTGDGLMVLEPEQAWTASWGIRPMVSGPLADSAVSEATGSAPARPGARGRARR